MCVAEGQRVAGGGVEACLVESRERSGDKAGAASAKRRYLDLFPDGRYRQRLAPTVDKAGSVGGAP